MSNKSTPYFFKHRAPEGEVTVDAVAAAIEAMAAKHEDEILNLASSGRFDEVFPFEVAMGEVNSLGRWDELEAEDPSPSEVEAALSLFGVAPEQAPTIDAVQVSQRSVWLEQQLQLAPSRDLKEALRDAQRLVGALEHRLKETQRSS
jgi:hypothetical protein